MGIESEEHLSPFFISFMSIISGMMSEKVYGSLKLQGERVLPTEENEIRNTKFINNSRGAIMKKVILIFLLMLTSTQIFADCYRGDRAYPTSATVVGMRCGADGYWH